MRTLYNICIFGVLAALLLPCRAQPGIATGQPSDNARNGLLTASGEGTIYLSAYLGTMTLKGKGDLLVDSRATVRIDGVQGEISEADADVVATFLPPSPKAKKPAPAAAENKKPAVKGAYQLYKGVNGTVSISENRFIAGFRGNVEEFAIYGSGVATLIGTGTYNLKNDGENTKNTGNWQPLPKDTDPPLPRKRFALTRLIFGENSKVTKAKPVKPAPPEPDAKQ